MLINTENFIKGSLLVAGLSFLLGGPAVGFLALTSIALIAASNNTHFYSYRMPYYQSHSSYPSPSYRSWSPFSRPSTHAATTVYLNRQSAAPRPILHQYQQYGNLQSQRTPDCELVGRHFRPAPRNEYRPW